MPTAVHDPIPPVADEFPSFADREYEFAAETESLRAIIEHQKNETREYVLRTFVLRHYADALENSASWRALAPLRWLRRQVRSPGFTADHLVPWAGLEPVEDAASGTWRAVDDDPQFVVSCFLPAGWVPVRLKMQAPARGQIEFYRRAPRRLRRRYVARPIQSFSWRN